MKRTRLIGTIGALTLFAAACDRAAPAAPTAPTTPTALTPSLALSKSGASCAVDVGTTTYPLRLIHEVAALLNAAIETPGSDVNCGQVRSLDAKLETITKALDRRDQRFHPACGVSGALLNEIAALAEGGRLVIPTFPAPFPGGPTSVIDAVAFGNAQWCAAARGDLVGERP